MPKAPSPTRLLPALIGVLGLAGAGVLVPVTATAQEPADLIISEYVEGSGNNKAVELYNGTGAPVDLSGYVLEVYFNGATDTTPVALTGSVADGDTFVHAHEDLASLADQTATGGFWNGDDAVVLRGPGGVVDSLGQVGVDPGSAWTSGQVSTQNMTLRRMASVCAGDTVVDDAFDPAAEWTAFARDTFDGLGAHTTDCSGTAPPPPPQDCGEPATVIGQVQGPGEQTPLAGQSVSVEGVVVGDFQEGGFNGYYVQDGGDGDPATSDGIFVYAPSGADVGQGDRVRVTGTAGEFNEMTQISASEVQVCAVGATLPGPVAVTLPTDDAELESTEGMYVTLPQSLAILEYFNYGRFGEIALGTDRQFQPTAVFEPGSADAEALVQANALSRITLDDGRSAQNPDPAIHPNGEEFTLDNGFRGGDLVTDATGVLDYRFDRYRVQPTQGAEFTVANPRPDVPGVGGNTTIASFNVLNYFTTLGSRGADDAEEFERQEAKIVAALTRLDADVVGLIEIENNGTALTTLVQALNEQAGADTYAEITTGPVGTDEITTAFVYRPARVSPVGDFATLTSADDPRFLDSKNRPALAQTFQDNETGGEVTVAVNHLKSKGSSCDDVGDPTDPDGQGNCNGVRTDAARALADWLAGDPTDSGSSESLIIGDLNSYDLEDPIDVLREAGWTDLLRQERGERAYSYVFDGQLGYLDYALASPSALPEVTGSAAWHINADEPSLLDYDTSFKKDAQDALYAPDAYRSSDHDPILVGMDLQPVQRAVDRLEGVDRYATAADIARELGPVDTVYVVSGQVFPDALSGAPLAIREDAAVLLTEDDDLPDASAAALTDLDPEQVVLLGGERRIGLPVVAEITALTGAAPARIAGTNRYDTAARIAERWDPADVDTVYLASGEVFADALAAGPLAGVGNDPVLLTEDEELPPETAAALEELAPDRIVVLGGEARIDYAVLVAASAYAADTSRLAGNDRYKTAVMIAALMPESERVLLASGQDFPDALGGSVLAGRIPAPLLLTRQDRLMDSTAQALLELDPTRITLLGGSAALSTDVSDAVRALWP